MLDPEQIEQYRQEGYLVVKDFVPQDQLLALRQRADKILDEFDPKSVSIFSTKNQTQKTDTYFLESANNISCFFEEKAFDDQGNLQQPKALSINKIGHALHDLDPLFRNFSRSEKMAELLRDLGYQRPLPVQSMYIFKQPRIGGEVVPHQDSTFLHTEPQTVMGVWVALEDANIDNGCLWGLPGSHKAGVQRRFLFKDGAVSFDQPPVEYDIEGAVPLQVPAGCLVLLHGAFVHFSRENSSPSSRHAYTVHVVDGAAEWSQENWLQRKEGFPFEPIYDANSAAA